MVQVMLEWLLLERWRENRISSWWLGNLLTEIKRNMNLACFYIILYHCEGPTWLQVKFRGLEYHCVCAKLLQSCPNLCKPVPTRLLCPWDSPGQNTGVGCCALLRISSSTRDQTCVSSPALADRFFTTNATREVHSQILNLLEFTK